MAQRISGSSGSISVMKAAGVMALWQKAAAERNDAMAVSSVNKSIEHRGAHQRSNGAWRAAAQAACISCGNQRLGNQR